MKTGKRQLEEVVAGQTRRKAFSSVIKGIDPETRRIDFIISTESVDRYGDVIKVKGWDLKQYKQNPVVLFGHMNREPPIGKAVKVWKDGTSLRAVAEFMPAEISPFADSIFQMYQAKYLRATSVGFLPIDWNYMEDDAGNITGYEFVKQDLLEFSAVPVPANPEALMDARAKGINVTPFKHWAEETLDNWKDQKDIVRRIYGVEKSTVESIRRKAAGTGSVFRLSAEQQEELRNRNLRNAVKDGGNKGHQKEGKIMEVKQGIHLVDAKDVDALKAGAKESELFLHPLPDKDGKKQFLALPQVDDGMTEGTKAVVLSQETVKGVTTLVIDKAPKTTIISPEILAAGKKELVVSEKDGNVTLLIKGSNFEATYKLHGSVEENGDIVAELLKSAEAPEDKKDADKSKGEEPKDKKEADKTDAKAGDKDDKKDDAKGAKSEAEDTSEEQAQKLVKDLLEAIQKKSKGGDKTKDVADFSKHAESLETVLTSLEDALDKTKDIGQSCGKAVARKLEFLAGYMRELAERISPQKKSFSLGSDESSKTDTKGAEDDDDISTDDLSDFLAKAVEPKIAQILERELRKAQGKLD